MELFPRLLTILFLVLLISLAGGSGQSCLLLQNSRSSLNGTSLSWINNALRAAEFSFQNLRTPMGNYVWDTSNVFSTSCWDNFSQFAALMAFGTQQILEFEDVELGLAALQVADGVLTWQQQHFWNPDPPGGFYAYSFSDGSNLDTSVQYSDDNCMAGAILYESHLLLISLNDTRSPVSGNSLVVSLIGRTLQQSEMCAQWAIDSQAWATVLGGGFWWNVSTAPPGYNQHSFRPDNSLFLCAHLFTELYGYGGNPLYLAWATKSLGWGLENLYDQPSNLFWWYSNINNTVNTSQFVYSNALAAYAFHRYAIVTQDPAMLSFAFNLSLSIHTSFWSAQASAFFESTLVTWAVSTSLSGWASKSLLPIALDHLDDPAALALLSACCQNVAFVQLHLRDPFSGAFYDSAFLNGDVPPSNLAYFSTLNSAFGQWLAVTLSPFCK